MCRCVSLSWASVARDWVLLFVYGGGGSELFDCNWMRIKALNVLWFVVSICVLLMYRFAIVDGRMWVLGWCTVCTPGYCLLRIHQMLCWWLLGGHKAGFSLSVYVISVWDDKHAFVVYHSECCGRVGVGCGCVVECVGGCWSPTLWLTEAFSISLWYGIISLWLPHTSLWFHICIDENVWNKNYLNQ